MSTELLAQQPTVDDQFTFMLKQFEKDDDFSRLMLFPSSLKEFKTELVSHLSCERNGPLGTSASSTIPPCPEIAREPVFHLKPRDSDREEFSKPSPFDIDDDLARIFDHTPALKPDMFTNPETRDYDFFREKLPHEFLAIPGDSDTSLDVDWTSPITASDDIIAGLVAPNRVPEHSVNVTDLRSGDVDMDMDLPDEGTQRDTAEALELEKRMSEIDRRTLTYKGPHIVSLFGRLYPWVLKDSQDLFCRGVALQQDENPNNTTLSDENDGDFGAPSPPSDRDSDYDSDSSGFVYTNISPPPSPNIMSVDRYPDSPGYAWSSSSLSSPPGTLSCWSSGASDADVDTESASSVVSLPPRPAKRKARQSDAPQPVKKVKLAGRRAVAAVPPTRARSPSPPVQEHLPTTQISSSDVLPVDIAPDVPTAAAAPVATRFSGEIPPTTTGDEPMLAASCNALPVARQSAESSRPFIARAQANATAGPSNNKKKFPCPMEGCHQVCTSPGDLERHLESRAHKAPSYHCLAPDCNKKYTRIDALKRHHDHAPACKRQHREQQGTA